jgi:cobalt-zinc-cadmium efflux system outer membrane protein
MKKHTTKQKKWLLVLVVFLLSGNLLSAQNSGALRQLVDRAINVNPQIKTLQAKLNMARENIPIGTNLPDPVFSVGLLNLPVNTFSFRQEAMTGVALNLTQTIPFPGSLKAKADVKAMDTLIVKQEVADLKNQIAQKMAILYYTLQEKRREIALAKESVDLLKQISLVAKRKFEVGTASLENVVQVEVQITRVKDKIEALKGEAQSMQAQLNAWLLRDEQVTISTPKIQPIRHRVFVMDTLLRLAADNRPMLKGIKLYQSKAVLQQKEVEKKYYPNFKVGMQYTLRSYNKITGINYPDFLGLVVGVTIPLGYGGNIKSQVNKSRYLQDYYGQQFHSSLQVLQQSFGKINAKINELRVREKLLEKTMLPQAEQAYQAAIADYQVNKIDFVNVIKAEDDILKIKTGLAKLRTSYFVQMAQLEFLTGTKLTY